ncbi:MAG TPA: hypothetical protein VMT76_16270 [Puia sp.]|nr:hypothetical protein [Puia sp.]
MSRKKIILIVFAFLFVTGGAFGTYEFFRGNPDMVTQKADFIIGAPDLLHEFATNDSGATKKYIGKIIEVKGTVKKVEKDDQDFFTVVVAETGNPSSIRCAIDSTKKNEALQLKEGTITSVKGIFTGYNKDETGLLGSDIQMNRCVISTYLKK